MCWRSLGEGETNSDLCRLEMILSGPGRMHGILPGETTLSKSILSTEN